MLTDCEVIMQATNPTELFGTKEKRARILYRRFARLTHPDLFLDPKEKQIAEKAFSRLNGFWDVYSKKTPSATAAAAMPDTTIKTKRQTFTIDTSVSPNEYGIFVSRHVTFDAGHRPATLYAVKNPADNDLGQTHATRLKELQKNVNEQFKGFYPVPVESFRHMDENHIERYMTVQETPQGLRPATDILKVYPKGIDGRDFAWIFRRMLVAVGNAHDAGYIHGAPTLEAFLIHPEQHGIMLDRWEYSVPTGETLKSIPVVYKDIYPTYVFDKEPVEHSLDINILANTANSLLREDAPVQFKAFLRACSRKKTLSAARLLAEFDALLLRLYGAPKFHPFTLDK